MKRLILTGMVALALLPAAASASTPQAWADLDKRVTRACIAMSGLATPQVLAEKVSTSDAIGVEVRMIRGYDSKKVFHRQICVVNRRTSRTEVHEAPSWIGASVKP